MQFILANVAGSIPYLAATLSNVSPGCKTISIQPSGNRHCGAMVEVGLSRKTGVSEGAGVIEGCPGTILIKVGKACSI